MTQKIGRVLRVHNGNAGLEAIRDTATTSRSPNGPIGANQT